MTGATTAIDAATNGDIEFVELLTECLNVVVARFPGFLKTVQRVVNALRRHVARVVGHRNALQQVDSLNRVAASLGDSLHARHPDADASRGHGGASPTF